MIGCWKELEAILILFSTDVLIHKGFTENHRYFKISNKRAAVRFEFSGIDKEHTKNKNAQHYRDTLLGRLYQKR